MYEGTQNGDRTGRAKVRSLTRAEFYSGYVLLCLFVAGAWLSLSVKSDTNQNASIRLVQSLDQARISKAEEDKVTTQAALDTILTEVRNGQNKTDAAAQANASAAVELGRQNSAILSDLRTTIKSHTSEIKAARNAANAAEAQSARTYRKVAKPTPRPWGLFGH